MKKLLFLAFFFFVASKVFAGTLVLFNDSPYELTAIVYSANGTFLGQLIIQPGMQANWVERVSPTPLKIPNTPSVSQTPYTVVWRCSHGESYSMCNDVSTGANVRATICPGNHFCPSKQDGEEKPKCPACAPCPVCPSK
jgi:hypothetical protein